LFIRLLTPLPFLILIVLPAFSAESGIGLNPTALDYYVREPDLNYKYDVVTIIEEEDYKTFIIEMTSQQWLTEAEVNFPIWEHFMVVVVPDIIKSDIGFLTITGGSKSNSAPSAPLPADVKRALETGTVVSTLYMVPNQPLIFSDDNGLARTEDSIIAYTWDKYLRTADSKWPLRLPMTKAAVRAMDTISDVMSSSRGGALSVDQFVIAGGSKRGWTTWTTALVDDRVIAIMPIVIDMLNITPSFKHHFSVYGAYSLAVIDYVTSGNVNWIGTPEWDSLMEIVEPYEYRHRLELPKYLLNSTGDEFFLPDSSQFYWNDLVGEKHLRYVPNSNHSMNNTDLFGSVDAWYHAIVHNVKMPRYSWDLDKDGTISVFSLDEPERVLLWQAHNPTSRNFTQDVIGRAYVSSPISEIEPGVFKVKLDPPEEGFTAYYLEMHYPSGIGVPFKFSTGVKVVPDRKGHDWEFKPDSAREK
jgi:PhoPQ-activated pathogenicity-related protein